MTERKWTRWDPGYDPRLVDGAVVTEDGDGRLIQVADCGQRCPGCGICCAGHRDVVTRDAFGTQEFEGNLKLGRNGLVKLDGDGWYRSAQCGESCPGYGRCCPPYDRRQRPKTVEDACYVLLESQQAWRWEMQEALLILAHDGSDEAVEGLEAYLPRAHTRLEGFAACALDEGRFFATVPRNAEERQAQLKLEVWQAWEDRAVDAQISIDEEIEPELERRLYELTVAQRLLDRAPDDAARQTWQTQVDVLQMLIDVCEGELEQQREQLALCEAMVTEIEADLDGAGPGRVP